VWAELLAAAAAVDASDDAQHTVCRSRRLQQSEHRRTTAHQLHVRYRRPHPSNIVSFQQTLRSSLTSNPTGMNMSGFSSSGGRKKITSTVSSRVPDQVGKVREGTVLRARTPDGAAATRGRGARARRARAAARARGRWRAGQGGGGRRARAGRRRRGARRRQGGGGGRWERRGQGRRRQMCRERSACARPPAGGATL